MNKYQKAKNRKRIREAEAINHDYGYCEQASGDYVDEDCINGICGYEPIYYHMCGMQYRHHIHSNIHLEEAKGGDKKWK